MSTTIWSIAPAPDDEGRCVWAHVTQREILQWACYFWNGLLITNYLCNGGEASYAFAHIGILRSDKKKEIYNKLDLFLNMASSFF
jgi:hypothetical protein